MSEDVAALTEVVWDGFSSSPFINITRRDAQSIAATVLASDWMAVALAEAWERGHFYCAAEQEGPRCVNPYATHAMPTAPAPDPKPLPEKRDPAAVAARAEIASEETQ